MRTAYIVEQRHVVSPLLSLGWEHMAFFCCPEKTGWARWNIPAWWIVASASFETC